MQDGTYGTTCPIPLGNNFIYMLQAKDQIGSFFYFRSLGLQKVVGGCGGTKTYSRPRIRSSFLSLLEIKLFLLVIGEKMPPETKTHVGHGSKHFSFWTCHQWAWLECLHIRSRTRDRKRLPERE